MSAREYYAHINDNKNNKRKRKSLGQPKRKRKNKQSNGTIVANSGTGLTRAVVSDVASRSECTDLNAVISRNLENSVKTGQQLLSWMINPIGLDDFMK